MSKYLSKGLKALAISAFTIALIIGLSYFAQDVDDETNDVISSPMVGIFQNGILRRYISTDQQVKSQVLDNSIIKEAEQDLRAWLKSQRQKHCKQLKKYTKPGNIQFATTGIGADGSHQYLMEVMYGKEVFLARFLETISKKHSNVTHKLLVKETVPNPCDESKKGSLAVKAAGLSPSLLFRPARIPVTSPCCQTLRGSTASRSAGPPDSRRTTSASASRTSRPASSRCLPTSAC